MLHQFLRAVRRTWDWFIGADLPPFNRLTLNGQTLEERAQPDASGAAYVSTFIPEEDGPSETGTDIFGIDDRVDVRSHRRERDAVAPSLNAFSARAWSDTSDDFGIILGVNVADVRPDRGGLLSFAMYAAHTELLAAA